MITVDSGLRFWLRYVEAQGGLTEDAGDSSLVVLPAALQQRLALPEELAVTGDPDVARDDGVLFLAAGHPLLGEAAGDLLAAGDVGRVAIVLPPGIPPDAAGLQERARDQFAVDHGRIDVTGPPTRVTRSVLRVGVLVSYTISAEDHYQERVECFVDAGARVALAESVATTLLSLPYETTTKPVDLSRLTAPVEAAHQLISAAAQRRQTSLAGQLGEALEAELARAEAYYGDMLANLAKRQQNAPTDRRELLDARANSVREERLRRLAEIREKFSPAHDIRPYRLHLYDVPAWRLPVDIRRGDRRYPAVLDWLPSLARFADIRCPHCDSTAPLVAAKTRLGCAECLAKPALQAVPIQQAPPATPPAPPKATTPVEPPTKPAKPVRTTAPPAPVDRPVSAEKLCRTGDKLSGKLWDAVAGHDRRLVRMCAPDSPAAAAFHLYGPLGAAAAIGVPLDASPSASSYETDRRDPAGPQATRGGLRLASGHVFPYLFWWRMVDGAPLIDEILPYDGQAEQARLPGWIFGRGEGALFSPPTPRITLDRVAGCLWKRGCPEHGLPVVLRCLTAWWRLPEGETLVDTHGAEVIAAAIDRAISQRAGQPGGRYAEAAQTYRVDERALRVAGGDLQTQLKLSATRHW